MCLFQIVVYELFAFVFLVTMGNLIYEFYTKKSEMIKIIGQSRMFAFKLKLS